jgi:HPt (histidine-containing phosphotransfer) domain-containing protein
MTAVSPDPRASGSSAIDRSVLGEWLAGDDAAIDELLVVFRDSVCAEQVRMREALALDDLIEYASAAHRLRGAALSMGARALADAVGTLYTAARADDRAACRIGLSVLETHVRQMVAEVPSTFAPGDGP